MAKKYKVSATTQEFTENTTLRPEEKYGAWLCVNTGTNTATVMGYELQPGEGLNFLNAVDPDGYWDTPIQIVVQPGAKVRITRLQTLPIIREKE